MFTGLGRIDLTLTLPAILAFANLILAIIAFIQNRKISLLKKENHKHDRHKTPPHNEWIYFAISLAILIYSLLLFFLIGGIIPNSEFSNIQYPYRFFTIAFFVILCLITIICALLLFFSKYPKYQTKLLKIFFSKKRNWVPYVALFTFLSISIIFGVDRLLLSRQVMLNLDQKYVVIVNEWIGEGKYKNGISEIIYQHLRNAFIDTNNIFIKQTYQALPNDLNEASVNIRELGKKYSADLIIWGAYYETNSTAKIDINIENLKPQGDLPLRSSEGFSPVVPITDLDTIVIQPKLADQMTALVLFLSGVIAKNNNEMLLAEGFVDQAISLNAWPDQLMNQRILFSFRANLSYQNHEFDKAIDFIKKSIAIQPTYWDYFTLASSYTFSRWEAKDINQKQEYSQKAIDAYLIAISMAKEFNETGIESYTNLCVEYFDANKYLEAKSVCQNAIKLYQENDEFRIYLENILSNVYIGNQEYGEAITLTSNIINRVSNSKEPLITDILLSDIYTTQGFAFQKNNDYVSAYSDYQIALEKNPTNKTTFISLGLYYLDKINYDKAIANFEYALSYDPSFYEACVKIGYAKCLKGNDYNDVVNQYLECIKIDNTRIEAYRGAANGYIELDQYQKAFTYIQSALSINPNDAFAHCYLGQYYLDQGNLTDAEIEFRMVVDLDTDSEASDCANQFLESMGTSQ
jgi:tetratricopeptide (TPR) repeat protein